MTTKIHEVTFNKNGNNTGRYTIKIGDTVVGKAERNSNSFHFVRHGYKAVVAWLTVAEADFRTMHELKAFVAADYVASQQQPMP